MKYVVKGSSGEVVECHLEEYRGGIMLYMGDWEILFIGEKGVKLARSVGDNIGVALDRENRNTVRVLEDTI